MKINAVGLLVPLLITLTACERLGITDPAKEAEAKEAEGKAIGGACRHAGRALEDCYALNPTAHKAAIFAGWKEMNDYMAENKIEVVKPELPAVVPTAKKENDDTADEESSSESSSSARSRRRPTRTDSGTD